ncbi:MAG: flagellar biosynthetic protein FliO [Desulfobulbaceae bacterium]|nr:flagellar biosynthetic protein FliO [Desulfobulbaceae bacterium]
MIAKRDILAYLPAWGLGGIVFFLASQALQCLAGDAASNGAFASPENASLLAAITKVFGSLLVVVGLILVLLYCIKRAGFGSGRGRVGSAIAVLESRMVAPKKYIAIVEIADKCLAVGITDHGINLLADLGPEVKESLARQSAGVKTASTFAGVLKKSMKSWQASSCQSGQVMDSAAERQELT